MKMLSSDFEMQLYPQKKLRFITVVLPVTSRRPRRRLPRPLNFSRILQYPHTPLGENALAPLPFQKRSIHAWYGVSRPFSYVRCVKGSGKYSNNIVCENKETEKGNFFDIVM